MSFAFDVIQKESQSRCLLFRHRSEDARWISPCQHSWLFGSIVLFQFLVITLHLPAQLPLSVPVTVTADWDGITAKPVIKHVSQARAWHAGNTHLLLAEFIGWASDTSLFVDWKLYGYTAKTEIHASVCLIFNKDCVAILDLSHFKQTSPETSLI